MAVVNRALSGPINIHCDHSDSMGARDSGWIQLYSENCQEVYDNLIQAVRIGEDKDVLLPVMVTFDGFIISHAMERVEILEDEEVKSFIGEFKAPSVIKKVGREFGKLSGRPYDLLEKYKTEEAELIIVAAGSTAGTVKATVDELREENVKAGLLKIRAFRPFPYQEIAQALKEAKAVAVLDRSASFGAQGGPLFLEVRSSLFEKDRRPPAINYIYGLGGRDIKNEQIKQVYEDLEEIAMGRRPTQLVSYLGVRE